MMYFKFNIITLYYNIILDTKSISNLSKHQKYNIFLLIRKKDNESVKHIYCNIDVDTFINEYNWTGLHVAQYVNNVELKEWFISKGADTSIKTLSGYSIY